jgi:hypothetical protein
MGNVNSNNIKSKYNEEKEVKLDLTLNKVCYLPGEEINGILEIQPNNEIHETILNYTNVNIKIIELQYYSYPDGDTLRTERNEKDIYTENFDFNNYKGANILSGLNIPFSFQIPLNFHASVIYDYNYYYVKHFLSVNFPGIKAKRTLMIIIKRFEEFSNENKLLRIPASAFGDFYKKKKSKYKGGKVTCLLKLPKNRFYYFELIPIEIYLDCTELNMEVKSIILKQIITIYCNYKDDEKKHRKTLRKIELFTREYPVNNSTNKCEIKDFIQLQKDKNFSEYIPNDKYCLLDEKKKIEVDHKFGNMSLIPFCFGGLINIEYNFQVEIIYKKNRSKNTFSLPIDLDANNNYDKNKEINEIINNHGNNNNSSLNNINAIDDNDIKQNMAEVNDFVIYEEDDFEKALFEFQNK